MNNFTELQQEAIEVMELIEDVVAEHCDTNILSGEKVWVMIKALADLKVRDFDSTFDTFYDIEEDDCKWNLSDVLLSLNLQQSNPQYDANM